jgi:phage-related protein
LDGFFTERLKEVSRRGQGLYQAQVGGKAAAAKPLTGFVGATVLEIVEDFRSDTYRAVYTVKFSEAVYVLHAFQKKSKKGVATPKSDLDLIKRRLVSAEADYETRFASKGRKR